MVGWVILPFVGLGYYVVGHRVFDVLRGLKKRLPQTLKVSRRSALWKLPFSCGRVGNALPHHVADRRSRHEG